MIDQPTKSEHTLQHALTPKASGCACYMADIIRCVICGAKLSYVREHVDTCSEKCFHELCRLTANHYNA
jgi:hypothetical protein